MDYTTEQRTILHLSLIDGAGSVSITKIIQTIPTLADIYTLSVSDVMHRCGFSHANAQRIVTGLQCTKNLDATLHALVRDHIYITTLVDGDYPSLLRHITVPPVVLYYKGVLPTEQTTSIAVVGSRAANHYGQQVVSMLVPPLVDAGCTIVSGGAYGIDTMAHKATLRTGGSTVVVLGSGLHHPYPAQNRRLFDEVVAAGGAVVSAFGLETRAAPGNFPARNRIIAGLSRATVVVQAAAKSGARITATYALEQGREVCAVPGPINDPLSDGCHALIGDGATLVRGPEDLLATLSLGQQTLVIRHEKNQVIPEDVAPRSSEEHIISLCRQPHSFDELTQNLGVEPQELQTLLFSMQLDGRIIQNFAGKWELSC